MFGFTVMSRRRLKELEDRLEKLEGQLDFWSKQFNLVESHWRKTQNGLNRLVAIVKDVRDRMDGKYRRRG